MSLSDDFNKTLQRDGNIFAEEFGEDVIYTPFGGSPRTVRAVVKRTVVSVEDQGGRKTPIETFTITIPQGNDPATQIRAVQERGDTIQFPNKESDLTNQTYRVTKIINQRGMWHLEVRK